MAGNGWKEFSSHAFTEGKEVGFVLNGESFACLPAPPATVWEGITATNVDPSRVLNFIQTSIASPEDGELFREMIESRENPVPIQVLTDVAIYLIEEYTARPTKRSTGSSGGPSNARQLSTVTSSPTASISTPFPSEEPSTS